MENSTEVPQKIKNWTAIWSLNPNSEYMAKRIKSRISKMYSHTLVHSSFIHNRLEVEAIHLHLQVNESTKCCIYTQQNIV